MDVKLVMFKRDGQRRNFAITHKITTIGRGEDCTLRIPLMSISRQHCELTKSDDELRIRDLASSNGTYINNQRVDEAVLKAGDRITLGLATLTVQIDGKPEQVASAKTKAAEAAEPEEIIEPAAGVGESEKSGSVIALEALIADSNDD